MQELYTTIKGTLEKVHKFVQKNRNQDDLGKIVIKKGADGFPTTSIDKIVEDKIIDYLSNDSYTMITEEQGTINPGKDIILLIDPIDGTTNAVAHIPFFSTSIAVVHNNKVMAGFVLDHATGNLFHGYKNKGAFLNKQKLQPNRDKKSKMFIGLGRPKSSSELSILQDLFLNHRTRMLCSPSLQLCYTAAGFFDSTIELHDPPLINILDIAAGKVILEEIGGIFRLPDLGEHTLSFDISKRFSFLAASNMHYLQLLHKPIKENLKHIHRFLR